jgi:hypothetical protein
MGLRFGGPRDTRFAGGPPILIETTITLSVRLSCHAVRGAMALVLAVEMAAVTDFGRAYCLDLKGAR